MLVLGVLASEYYYLLFYCLALGFGFGKSTTTKTNFFNARYCLSHSPVPVIVVRPGRKLKKAVEKRRADPKRGTHFEEGV